MSVAQRTVGRRTFLGACSAAAAVSILPTRYAFAGPLRGGPAYTGDTLVVLSLRGAADWLSLVPPLGDRDYAPARPTIAVPASSAGQLDGFFGLHPALSPLLPLYQQGTLAFAHAVGNPDPSRSHFDATRLQELAGFTGSGWLERVSAATGGTGALNSLHLGGAQTPVSQSGGAPATAITALSSFSLTAPSEGYAAVSRTLDALFHRVSGASADATRDALAALPAVGAASRIGSAAAYPPTRTAAALADVARLVRAGVGLQVASIDLGGWDMHANLGKAGTGQMATRAAELAGAVAAFAADLGPLLGRVTLVTLTEFGRRVAENGNAGTDHGHGYGMLLLGGNVNGGKVYAQWPSLAPAALDRGDLVATVDYRQILGEILRTRMGVDQGRVFPGVSGSLGVVR